MLMKHPLLPTIERCTAESPDMSVIWLHGLGADGHDFEPIVPQLGLAKNAAIRFVFPHAPAMPVSINDGYIMPAWYDIKHHDLHIEHDAVGIQQTAQAITALIERECSRGIAQNRIVLAGFSQGGAIALYCGLRQQQALAGVIALSCYRLLPEETDTISTHKLPLFIAHGINDDIVPFALADTMRHHYQDLGHPVDWHAFPMQHSVCPEEIHHLGQWLMQRYES